MAARPRRIVVGYDGSPASQRALDAAAELVGYGSTLAVVSVVANGEGSGARLAEAHERLLARHVLATYLQPVGDPADQLLEAARALEADLLVVGRRRRGPFRRFVVGSVSDDVLRRAACDVLVVSEIPEPAPTTPR